MGRWQDAWLEECNYMNDPRVTAKNAWAGFDEKRNVIKVDLYLDDDRVCDVEFEAEFPAKMMVCSLCHGKGSHVNPSIDASGISGSAFDEDPGFAEDYVNGRYDVPCNACMGKRVVPVIDTDSRLMEGTVEVPEEPGEEFSPTHTYTLHQLYKAKQDSDHDDAVYESMARQERMMGA